jgi:surface carbohydrate biosynthesis protein
MMFKKTANVALHIVDSPRRDLVWRLVLAKALQAKNIDSYIGRADSVSYLAQFQANAVLCGRLGGTSGRSPFDKALMSLLRRMKSKIFYIHDEGGAFFESDYARSTRLNYPSDMFEDEVFEKIYFWGRRQQDVFAAENWLGKSKVVGAPRFDVLKMENQPSADDSKGYYELLEPYILVNSRFSNVLTSNDDVSALSSRMFDIRVEGGEREFKSDDQIKAAMYSRWASSAQDYIAFVDMLAKVCLKFPDINFLLRPHPAEDDNWYRNNLALIPNINVEKRGDVQLAIASARAVIGSDCTTGLEAVLMGKQYINFIPFPDEGVNTVGLAEVGSLANTSSEVISLVNQVLEGEVLESSSLHIFDDSIVNVASEVSALDEITGDIDGYFKTMGQRPSGVGLRPFMSMETLKHVAKYLVSPWRDARGGGLKYVWPDSKEMTSLWLSLGGKKTDLEFGYNYIRVKSRSSGK